MTKSFRGTFVSGALFAALSLPGCSDGEAPLSGEVRSFEIRRPLVGFHPEPRFRVAMRGEPEMRWLGVEGEPRRAFVCSEDCGVTFDPRRFQGGFLEAVAAVLPESGSRSRVAFQIGARVGDGAPKVLWQASLSAGESRTVRVVIPEMGAALRLQLDVRIPTGASSRAAWMDPAFVRERSALQASSHAPNVVLITSDTTRQDELSCYGGPTATPEIDRLAAEGVLFDDAHSVAFGTNPSHASLMTSTHASRHGVIHNRSTLGDELPTLAEVLGENGYATAAFVGAVVLARAAGLARGFDRYDDGVGVERPGDVTVSMFERWLADDARAPFFAWIHLYDPHQPYAPPERRASAYLGEAGDPVTLARVDAAIARSSIGRRAGFIDPAEIETYDRELLPDVDRVARARYRGEIAFVDEQVGRIRAALQGRGLLDRTLIAFTADHGENFLDRGTGQAYNHAGLRVDVSRIPMILRLPDGRARGRSNALVGNLDLAPTIAALAGVPAPAAWRGKVLLDQEGQQASVSRDHLIIEGSHRREIGVRTRDWLYRELREPVRNRRRVVVAQGYALGRPFEIYERATDPGETRNVYAADHLMLPQLRSWIEAFEGRESAATITLEVTPEHARALRALGYVEDDRSGLDGKDAASIP